jgi:RNA polymerase sigma-70 factor, ECF subfamily
MFMRDVTTTRFTLIERLKDPRDVAAWDDFYQFYWELITGWAKRFGCDPARAEDVFQETMICLLRKLQNFEYDPGRGSFRGLLKTITRSRVLDMFRREGRYKTMEDITTEPEFKEADLAPQGEAEEDLIWMQTILQQALRKCYSKIDQDTYKSFCLYVLEGEPVEKVCKRLEIARPGTVYQQKSRFLKLLEKEFYALLKDFDEVRVDAVSAQRTYMIKALEEMIRNKPDYRETIVQPQVPRNLNQLSSVVQVMRKNGFPDAESAHNLLLMNNGEIEGFELKDRLKVGNKAECDIVVDSAGISGLHAEFFCEGQNYAVRDLTSANGIFINGRKADSETISAGDIVQLSETVCFVFIQ